MNDFVYKFLWNQTLSILTGDDENPYPIMDALVRAHRKHGATMFYVRNFSRWPDLLPLHTQLRNSHHVYDQISGEPISLLALARLLQGNGFEVTCYQNTISVRLLAYGEQFSKMLDHVKRWGVDKRLCCTCRSDFQSDESDDAWQFTEEPFTCVLTFGAADKWHLTVRG